MLSIETIRLITFGIACATLCLCVYRKRPMLAMVPALMAGVVISI